jgi:excinuclease ABC subunit C
VISSAEVLEAFIGQFYDQKDPPRQLILSHPIENADLMADALSQKLGRKVEILVPQRGEKAELVDGALRNARESLARQMAEGQAQAKLLARAGGGLRPRRPAARIEVYDNSHIQGTNAVGAMIVAGPEGFVKSSTASSTSGRQPDARRRFRHDEGGADPAVPAPAEGRSGPRDGGLARPPADRRRRGAGQAVKEIMDDLGVEDVPFIGVAKGIDRDQGKEEFHRPGSRPSRWVATTRCSISSSACATRRTASPSARTAQKRAKAVSATPLDDIPGVGATRKRALLTHFGSAKAVSRANLADLKAVEGVSEGLAQKIYDFHERGFPRDCA